MNVSFSIANTPINLQSTQDTTPTPQTSNDKSLVVSITNGTQQGSPVQPSAINLSFPMIGPEDIPLNELAQQLEKLNLSALKSMNTTAAVLVLGSAMGEIAAAINKGGTKFIEENKESLGKFFDEAEKKAAKAETQLFDLINNSTYPEFNEFLGKMLDAAQELRHLAAEAKHHLVLGQYNNMLDQAKQMEIAAQKNYESTMKEIKASQTEAIGKIVGGAINIASAGIGGKLGGWNTMAVQAGQGVGAALSGITDGISSLIASQDRMDGAMLKKEADLAGALQKKLEATGKLLQEAEGITDELMNIAKSLADMVLKLYQDFISSQNQIVQRSNI